MDKNLQQTLKTILISALVSANVLIWYEILGIRLLIGIFLIAMYVLLSGNSREGK